MRPTRQNSQKPAVAGVAKKKRVTKSKRAGLLFPVARIRHQLKAGRYAKIIQNGSAVYMAAVLEYLAAELLEITGNAASENNRKRINPRHITTAVRTDSEFDELFRNVTIAQGGVIPFIHPELLTARSTSSRSQPSSDPESQAKSGKSSYKPSGR